MKNLRKKNHNKIGILGGTFDPPHKGHLYISEIALKKLKLKKVLWIVTKKNPLKKNPYLPISKRLKLSKKTVKKQKKIFVRYLDNKIKSTNTFDLLKYIKNKNKNFELFFLIGSDNLAKFHKWKNWRKIATLAKIVIFPRKNYPARSSNYLVSKVLDKNRLIYMNSKKINISSSLIRKFW